MRHFTTVALTGVLLSVALTGCGDNAPASDGGPPVMRRLTEDQYRQIIADVFGPDIVIGGRFDPIVRVDGLVSVGAGATAINSAAFERYDTIGRSVAAQVVDPVRRDMLVPCRPADPAKADDACARQFFAGVGRLLFRRTLTETELAGYAALADDAANRLGNFYVGISAALSAMLVRPEFLFITDTTEPDPDRPGEVRLTAKAKATRLSFLLWNTTPDDALLTAAEQGQLDNAKDLARHVDRMLASPRLEAGVRALFADMLAFESFETLQKDPVIYPALGLVAIEHSREQLLRTITDHLLVRGEGYPGLFTTRKTVMSGPLGLVYRVPVADPDAWIDFEFPAGDQRVGIQALIGFSALHSHPGRSSATLRGKAVREILMCQKVPDPPANVDFTLVSDSTNPIHKTARQRLDAHNTEPSCVGCHKLMDPIGLSLETLDGAGQLRTTENGVPIDVSGELDGVAYSDAIGLGAAIAQNAAVPACLVSRAVAYGLGRTPSTEERAWLAAVEQRFAKDGYGLKSLLRAIAVSPSFYAVTPPADAGTVASVVEDKHS
ncbi:MAG: DUF1588 domain-containing protein [Rhodospirillaceae bacterium]|nr:DUF1588 domain-containing protein [Rhodospirillaceae bacterium]